MNKYSKKVKQVITLTEVEQDQVNRKVADSIEKKSALSKEKLIEMFTKQVIAQRPTPMTSKEIAKMESRSAMEAKANDPSYSFDWFGYGDQASYQRACLGSKWAK
jgi:hypothetical protein